MYTDTHRTAQEPRGKLSQNIIIPLRTQGHYRAFKTLFYISLEAIAECSQLHSSSSDLQTILERRTAADTTRRSILEALPGQTEPRQTQPSGSDLQQLLRAYRIRHGRRALGAGYKRTRCGDPAGTLSQEAADTTRSTPRST